MMTPNPETAAALADALAVTEPDAALRILDDLADQLMGFALSRGCCADCAGMFTLSFLRLVTGRLEALSHQRTVH